MRLFKTAYRNLIKHRVVSLINIIGLTFGLLVSVLLLTHVNNEYNVDEFIPDVDHVFAIQNRNSLHLSGPLIDLIRQEVPEVGLLTYCTNEWAPQVFFSKGHSDYLIDNLIAADSLFFNVFPFPVKYGSLTDALTGPNKVVLTEELSTKIFGNKNPVGQSVTFNSTYLNNVDLVVSAVLRQLPPNTSWKFEAINSIQTNEQLDWFLANAQYWTSFNFTGYGRFGTTTDLQQINQKLANISLENVPEKHRKRIQLKAVDYKNLYFDHTLYDEIREHGNQMALNIITLIALLIVAMACVNYINLFTAQRESRIRIIALNKLQGAQKKNIIKAIMAEAILVLFVVCALLAFLFPLGLNLLNRIFETNYTLTDLLSSANTMPIGSMLFVVLVFTGLVPGFVYNNYKALNLLHPATAMKGKNVLRNILPVFQYVIAISLIISLLVIVLQVDYLIHADPGFKKENIVYTSANRSIRSGFNSFKDELLRLPHVNDIAYSEEPLSEIEQNWGVEMVVDGVEKEIWFAKSSVSENFFDFFGLQVINGNAFNENSDEHYDIILNNTAIKNFEISKIENAKVNGFGDDPNNGKIIGVIKDFHFESFQSALRPMAFMHSENPEEILYLKLTDPDIYALNKTLENIQKVWNEFSPDIPFDYTFLDETWHSKYTAEIRFRNIIFYAALVALFLSSLGLIGLSFYIIEKKRKELGIRKVNGATALSINLMLNKMLVQWVLVAFVLSVPITYWAMSGWLEHFAYKIKIGWWIFILAGIATLIVAIVTTSWQSWRAATRNPVEALRYE